MLNILIEAHGVGNGIDETVFNMKPFNQSLLTLSY